MRGIPGSRLAAGWRRAAAAFHDLGKRVAATRAAARWRRLAPGVRIAIAAASGRQIASTTVDAATASKLKQKRVRLNGRGNPEDDLSDAPPVTTVVNGPAAALALKPYSVTLVHVHLLP